ncbi:MAG TPA: aromatic amino acid ammonia-lyase, partial [Fibrobacteraceae bacterium]|nr:aromatic amino acid ammonia-lyase [Fibrobacteraceae bacterium]
MNKIVFGRYLLSVEDVVSIAEHHSDSILDDSSQFQSLIERGSEILAKAWREDRRVYGVTTGVGDSVVRPIPRELVPEFPSHLMRFHGCGLGRYFGVEDGRAILAVRTASLCRGYSGVRFILLEHLAALLREDVIPQIPEEGSVGASGDLTPLSYVAAVLMGEREVYHCGKVRPAAEALADIGLPTLELHPKEALALMNGTSVMTALAARNWVRADYLLRLSARVTALVSEAMMGNKAHFHPVIFQQKPHPGQAHVAAWIAKDVGWVPGYFRAGQERLQDTYAVRCAPHVLGVLADALPWIRQQIETELNSANDNPLIDPNSGEILHGGNFYGGHIGFAMDGLKNAVANIADLLDRQVILLVNEKTNRGLVSNLTGAAPERQPVNHAFKAIGIATSAWAAEALKAAIPASIFSRSTESHNQDKVSMGTIAARDAVRVLELTEQVLVATLLVACQGLELR